MSDLNTRYGGIDSVLIWPTYPNIGIDNRNQYDMLRDMPGGLDGVKNIVVSGFHDNGVKVLSPLNPWEIDGNGNYLTRPEGLDLPMATAINFKTAGIDGVNGDTMGSMGPDYWNAANSVNHLLAFECEGGCIDYGPFIPGYPLDCIQYDTMGWGEHWLYNSGTISAQNLSSFVEIDRAKWIESRHLTNICERWATDRIEGLQMAFVNGDGYESWENVWGVWNGITPRSAQAIRCVATVERGLSSYLVSPNWQPLVPTLQTNVYASMFPQSDATVWLIINPSAKNLTGNQITVPYLAGMTFYDVWHGVQLTPSVTGSNATLSFPIEGHGFGAIAAFMGAPSAKMSALFSKMASLTKNDLSTYNNTWQLLQQQIVDIPFTPLVASAPSGMVTVPGGLYNWVVNGIEFESITDVNSGFSGDDVQNPWETAPGYAHNHQLQMPTFYIDKYPVTNGQFKAFLTASHYYPVDDHNFLRDWINGNYPEGWDNKPVTWVSQEDARAYAAFYSKRLPHEWEWQYAAQGTDGRLYPWGSAADPTRIPPPDYSPSLRPPTDVNAYPTGASAFGVIDMTGNVWQWTDEYQDLHTRAAILRGGSYYRPVDDAVSFNWYFPPNTTLDQHGKYLLMCPGLDRAGTIGFRCVVDSNSNAPSTKPVITSSLTANGTIGVSFNYQITATLSPASYSVIATLLPPGLSLNTTTGVITGIPSAAGTYLLTLNATNAVGSGMATMIITIAAPSGAYTPAITSPQTVSGSLSTSFNYKITATNSPTSYNATGTFPPGLAFNSSTGVISGTPTAAGEYSVILNANNSFGTVSFPLEIQVGPTIPVITSPLIVNAMGGSPFSYQIAASNSPTVYSLGGILPPGLLFNSATGTIAGSPSALGTFTVSVGANNAYGIGTATLVIMVQPSSYPPVITSPLTATGTLARPFNYQILATNIPTNYSLIGNLPPGISLNSSTGALAGTPSATGTYPITLIAANSAGTGSAKVTLSINLPGIGALALISDTTATTTAVNLTTLGISDWRQWGYTAAAPNYTSYKGIAGNLISDFTILKSGTTVRNYSNNLTPFTWSDGSPNSLVSNTYTGDYVSGLNNGFSFTLASISTIRTAIIYVGGWASSGQLSAGFADGSATPITSIVASNSTSQYFKVYTISYASSSGSPLTVKWTQTAGTGNVTLNAVYIK